MNNHFNMILSSCYTWSHTYHLMHCSKRCEVVIKYWCTFTNMVTQDQEKSQVRFLPEKVKFLSKITKLIRWVRTSILHSTGFCDLGTTVLGQIILCYEGCPAHSLMFSSTPDLQPLPLAKNIPLTGDSKICVQTLPSVSWGTKRPPAEMHRSKTKLNFFIANTSAKVDFSIFF